MKPEEFALGLTTDADGQEYFRGRFIFDRFVDADIAARKVACNDCLTGPEAYIIGTRKVILWCSGDTEYTHLLKARGKSPVQNYLETGEGDAITRQNAERYIARIERKQEDEGIMAEQSQAVATTKPNTLAEVLALDSTKQAISEVLPKAMDANRFLRLSLTALRRTPKLQLCTPESFMGALAQCAVLGLEPETPLAHAYLIPYGKECTLVLGYKGLIDLARRSGQVNGIYAEVVYAGDMFEWEQGLNPTVRHKRLAEPVIRNTNGKTLFTGQNVTHAYAVAKVNGDPQFVVMTKTELDSIKSQSKAGNDGPWVTHPEEMMKKSAIRRLSKLLPLSIEIHQALAQEEERTTINVIGTTGEIVDAAPSSEVVPPEPLDDCPEHHTPWVMGDKGGLYHAGGCTPSKVLTAAAEAISMDKAALDTQLKDAFGGKTASKLDADEVAKAYALLTGEVAEDSMPDDVRAALDIPEGDRTSEELALLAGWNDQDHGSEAQEAVSEASDASADDSGAAQEPML